MDKHVCIEHIVDMNLKCCLQTSVDIVSNSRTYFNSLFNFPEKATLHHRLLLLNIFCLIRSITISLGSAMY